ncbi:ABC transporter substrate-binding protein [Actinoplanes siamensis]|uniref:ABC transporter substrate-binding protein n=1 Tax=Actinoplanes siamensis TaxID=1223317 RepID=A0A919N3Y1_9ACTN|nr:ABC transporter substrate-binding protein [Actinoplanes siamensis]GIF03933.1 ABC transporter substrate-binding protein [Actinoplanes siamensis]
MTGGAGAGRKVVLYTAAALIAIALVGLLVALRSRGGGRPGEPIARPSGGCPAELTAATGECLGPVTGSARLDPVLRPVADKIFRANEEMKAKQGKYVRIVLLTPLGVPGNANMRSAISIDQVRFSLEGAYTALLRANSTREFYDPDAPGIELVLVEQGSRQEYVTGLRDAILALSVADHPVVAVAGLGSSFAGTEEMTRALAEAGIPAIGAVTSATSLTAATARTFHSVSPSNVDYALALKHLLTTQKQALPVRNALIVADQNDDPYPRTLRQALQTQLKDYLISAPQVFSGSTVETPVTANVFVPIVTNICSAMLDPQAPLDTVFFAGRVADFGAFADALATRVCRQKPLTVMVGATGFQAAQDRVKVLDEARVTVIYASSGDSPGWLRGGPGVPEGYPAFHKRFLSAGFDEASLSDGYAVSYHDAIAAAVSATRLAALGNPVPTAADVQTQFANLSLANTVKAGAGTLDFGSRSAGDGRASGKVVVFRQIGTSGMRLPADVPPYLTD